MPRTRVTTDVPAEKVDQVVEDYESDGATVTKTRQRDGKYTVRAVYPDPPPGSPTQG